MTGGLASAAAYPGAAGESTVASPDPQAEREFPRGRAAVVVATVATAASPRSPGGSPAPPALSLSLRPHARLPREVVAGIARASHQRRNYDSLPSPENAPSPASPLFAERDAHPTSHVSGRSRSAESISSGSSTANLSAAPGNGDSDGVLVLDRNSKFSILEGGERIACAAKKQFFVLARKESRHARRTENVSAASADVGMEIVGQGSGCLEDRETITAISCLPLFVPPSQCASTETPVFVAVGYSTGWFRIYNQAGKLLIAQLLHPTTLTAIKIRTSRRARSKTSPPGVDASGGYDEEVMLMYQDGRVVAAEGGSLWMAIRAVERQMQYDDGAGVSNEWSNPANQESATFAYKKWAFNNDQVTDVITCGPARVSPAIAMSALPPTVPSSLLSTVATARYIVVGTNPMVSYHATTDTSRPLLSTVSLANVVASATRVTSVVLGFAKSWWGTGGDVGSPQSTGGGSSNTPTSPKDLAAIAATEPATPMPALASLTDPGRRMLQVTLAPQIGRASQLAACLDSLGRVMLLDVDECELVRMWKGMRGAQCAWVVSTSGPQTTPGFVRRSGTPGKLGARRTTPRATSGVATSVSSSRRATPSTATGGQTAAATSRLFLAIYTPKRGILEVWRVRHGCRVASRAVGPGCILTNVVGGRVGAGMILGSDGGDSQGDGGARGAPDVGCFLVDPAGEVWAVEVAANLAAPSPTAAPSKPAGRLGAVRKTPAAFPAAAVSTTAAGVPTKEEVACEVARDTSKGDDAEEACETAPSTSREDNTEAEAAGVAGVAVEAAGGERVGVGHSRNAAVL